MSFDVYVNKSQCLRKRVFAIAVPAAVIGFLALLILPSAVSTAPVEAQTPAMNLYIEPGTIAIRTPDGGGTIGDGKLVIDLRTGDAWGFPTNLTGSPYPVNTTSNKPPTAKPVYLGRFDFSEMKRPE